jgi:hypothetical protein
LRALSTPYSLLVPCPSSLVPIFSLIVKNKDSRPFKLLSFEENHIQSKSMSNLHLRLTFKGILFLLLVSIQVINAQETVPVAGGTIAGSGGSVSYTVGQVAYTTVTGAGGTVTQGVQQPYVISVISEVPEASEISLNLTVFPNPASQFVMLKIENLELSDMACRLYDTDGKLLQDIKIDDKLTTIPMDDLLRATYFLKVMQGQREIKVFMIVKE